jgi:hypothetical protein
MKRIVRCPTRDCARRRPVRRVGGHDGRSRAAHGLPLRRAPCGYDAHGGRRVPPTSPGVVHLVSGDRRAAKQACGGAGPVRVGQAGEDAVRGAYDIGPKTKIDVAGRKRIPDGLTSTAVSEVKNVSSLRYSQQLRDFAHYAQQSGRSFDLYVRPTTRLSGRCSGRPDGAGRSTCGSFHEQEVLGSEDSCGADGRARD